jgi:hypothetical protein
MHPGPFLLFMALSYREQECPACCPAVPVARLIVTILCLVGPPCQKLYEKETSPSGSFDRIKRGERVEVDINFDIPATFCRKDIRETAEKIQFAYIPASSHRTLQPSQPE